MIEMSPATAIMVYLCGTLVTLLILWGRHHYRSRRQKLIISKERLQVCEYCHFAYMERMEKALTQCPQCGSFNKS